ncbi:hypothetical protein GJ744_005924 [Endocarpon pusillum]|uniref:Uncharacterized protein n=1 Tax=Endocarpon pusillum TaxID=364733 RepID=A0A8H7AMD7_9EURO|nr:hypothetical protein GJ744_005924 [Endocarpon pusillum]
MGHAVSTPSSPKKSRVQEIADVECFMSLRDALLAFPISLNPAENTRVRLSFLVAFVVVGGGNIGENRKYGEQNRFWFSFFYLVRSKACRSGFASEVRSGVEELRSNDTGAC